MTVTFDYTSDLHIDLTFSKARGLSIEEYFKNASAKHLIVAGDIGHYLEQNIETLTFIKNKYRYENIILVMGNHDRYQMKGESIGGSSKKNFSARAYENAGFIVLDGNSVDIEGCIVGGADGWYDGQYKQKSFIDNEAKLNYWKNSLNDFSYGACSDYKEVFQEEKFKLQTLYAQCDVVVSHFRPTINENHIDIKFRGMPSNMFFGFDYEQHLKLDPRLKVWVFGHVHDCLELQVADKRLLCNPLGYWHEHDETKYIKQFEVEIDNGN